MKREDAKRIERNRHKTELTLGQVIDHMDKSSRIAVITAGGYPVYRGYVGNYNEKWVDGSSRVDRVMQNMETYRTEDGHFDWRNIEELPPRVPNKDIPIYRTGDLTHLIYTEIRLESVFMGQEETGDKAGERMGQAGKC